MQARWLPLRTLACSPSRCGSTCTPSCCWPMWCRCRQQEKWSTSRSTGARRERVAHGAHARQVAQAVYVGQVRARVEQVVQVEVREARHVGREGRAREVLAVRRPGDAVPGREAEPYVLADGADPSGCHELARGVGRRGGREHALAVRVEMRPEPGAPIVVRVREHAARAQLAHARSC